LTISFEAFARGVPCDLGHERWYRKTLSYPSVVLTEYQHVTDGRTDGHTVHLLQSSAQAQMSATKTESITVLIVVVVVVVVAVVAVAVAVVVDVVVVVVELVDDVVAAAAGMLLYSQQHFQMS